MTTLNDHLSHLVTFAGNFITHWMEDDGNDAEDKACCTRAEEANADAETALGNAITAGRAMLAALIDAAAMLEHYRSGRAHNWDGSTHGQMASTMLDIERAIVKAREAGFIP